MWLVKIALGLAGAYLVIVAFLYAAQTWLLFPTWLVSAEGPALPPSAQRIEAETPDGVHLVGHHIPATGAQTRPLVLGFGGNAWQAGHLALYLHQRLPGAPVVAFHYRGYGASAGRPSAEALLADALVVHDRIVAALAPERVVAVGLSIGAGPAAELARHRPLAGLILVTPFDSLEAMAGTHYPWVPVRWLLRHRMPVVDTLEKVSLPVAVITAGDDTIVPSARSAPVRKAVNRLVYDRTIDGTDHNALYGAPEFSEALAEAFARIEAVAP